MKRTLPAYLFTLILITGFAFQAFSLGISSSFFTSGSITFNNLELTLKQNAMLFENRNGSGEIKITETGGLFMDDKEILTTDENKIQLIDFYHKTELIYNKAMAIGNDGIQVGKQGAKIGGKGAMLGLKAVAGVITMLATFDSDSFEKMMEKEAAKVEAEAAVIEKMADKIEKKADRLEKYARSLNSEIEELKKSINELSSAKWFYF